MLLSPTCPAGLGKIDLNKKQIPLASSEAIYTKSESLVSWDSKF